MKVIFLDLDGVLNVQSQERDKYGSLFHQNLVDNLKRIIDETDAKIVISSTWRHSGLSVMQDMWKSRNLPGEVIDITIDLWSKDFKDVSRGEEIQHWLDIHTGIQSYVIIDDDTDFLPNQLNNFVQTSDNQDHTDFYDIGYGLTVECADQAIKILNNARLN